MSEELKFKVILVGDTSVGKTSVARRQAHGSFDFRMTPTVGVDHMISTVQIGDKTVKLMLWDTAGQEQFAALVPMYIRGAHVCIIVASIMDPDSCEHIALWKERVESEGENPPMIVAINKTDLIDGAPVSLDDMRKMYADTYENLFFVSARTGDGITQLFQQVGIVALAQASKELERAKGTALTSSEDGDKKSCFC
jgi:small GTP-binding protein